MANIPANEGDWELFEILGHNALFSNYRVDRTTIPDGLHAYDIREDDDLSGTPSGISKLISVNHMGTVLTREPVPEAENGEAIIPPDGYNFLGGEATVDEFINDLCDFGS